MNRWLGLLAFAACAARAIDASGSPPAASGPMRLFADTDDDDDDGIADHNDAHPERARDVAWVGPSNATLTARAVRGDALRLVLSRLQGMRGPAVVGLQGLHAGTAQVVLAGRSLDVAVCELSALDHDGSPIDLATSHASLSRTVPLIAARIADEPADVDALAWMVACPTGALPGSVRFETTRQSGEPLDVVDSAPLIASECPPRLGGGLECGTTERIRLTADLVDRSHPSISGRSLRAEVGGRVLVKIDGKKASSIRVGGPRETALGPIERYRGRLRFHVVRASPGGQAAVGGGDQGARGVARDEARTASMLWGQCGAHFGPDEQLRVDIVDPPPRYLVAVGCDLGLPASGGLVSLGIDDQTIRVSTREGDAPVSVAHAVAAAANAAGFRAVVSPNARILPGALRTADVLVRHTDGSLVDVHPLPSIALSSDPTLGVCVGEVNLGDGLAHFDDLDAAAGTVEERTLVKAYQDGDPSTIDVFIVPSFSKTGRIGESFIDADGSSIQNAIIVDRAGIRSGARSYAVAHEIGHVLLDMPGHPDDYGVDRPWVLMDADAADPTIFGPRRLSKADCERAVIQSGPGSAVPLLEPWPLYKSRAKEIVPMGK